MPVGGGGGGESPGDGMRVEAAADFGVLGDVDVVIEIEKWRVRYGVIERQRGENEEKREGKFSQWLEGGPPRFDFIRINTLASFCSQRIDCKIVKGKVLIKNDLCTAASNVWGVCPFPI